MRKIILLLSLAAGLFALDFTQIKSNIKTQNISGNFTQTKILNGFNSAFKAQGEFVMGEGELTWAVKSPVATVVVINGDGIFSKDGDKLTKIDQNFDKKLFLSIISLNIGELEREFEFEISGSKESWRIALKPKNILLKQIFSSIEILGDQFIRKITLDEISGDKTINEFFDVK